MAPMKAHGVLADVCPKCKGLWLDRGELARATETSLKDDGGARLLAGARRQPHKCPTCGVPLYEHPLIEHAHVLVDQCPTCRGTFLEKGEYTKARNILRQVDPKWRKRHANKTHYVDEDDPRLMAFQWLTGLPVEMDVRQSFWSPTVTALIVMNVAMLAFGLVVGLDGVIDDLGFVPAQMMQRQRLHTWITAMFVHAGVLHLVGNMYFLFMAGDNVEEDFHWYGFLPFYLACGLAAALAHALCTSNPNIPAVGASGAISGVLGAYMVLYPKNRFLIRSFYLGMRYVEIEVPAYAYLGFWVALQLLYAFLDIGSVAWMAHAGGFACGAVLAGALRAWRSAGGVPEVAGARC